MFEKTLTDLIRGIRANKRNESKYIAACLQEIRQEVKSSDPDIKSNAIAKLTYLQMLGYDMSWAAFHVVEVMSSPKFFVKRTGYLAAAQSFQQNTDVLMLTTNLIRKDLASAQPLDIAVALNGLSHIVTPDLARDLSQDLVSMLTHSRPYIRKKVVLMLYKVFLRFPEALRLSFPRLREKLEDPDPSVVSAAVNVICELSRKNPKNYLALAPQLFKLLTSSSNNWMLIKIVKLFAALTPLEPRLAKKLLPPLTTLIQTTPAMSLLYECVYTVIAGGFLEMSGDQGPALAAMCANKLRIFLEDSDQNLKYIGLLALHRMLPEHTKSVAENRDIIIECVDDPDFSIRMRALDLIVGLVNRNNLIDIVKKLMSHLLPSNTGDKEGDDADDETAKPLQHQSVTVLNDPNYRLDIIHRIVHICSQNQYANITGFEWYMAILVDLTYIAGVNAGDLLTSQLLDVAVRVKSVRPYAVKIMSGLLNDQAFLDKATLPDSNAEVLYAAAWICGEYCSYLEDIPATLERLLANGVTKLSPATQALYVQNILKIYVYWVSTLVYQWDAEVQQEFLNVTQVIKEKMEAFCRSFDLEVQERASNAREIFSLVLSRMQNDANFASTNSAFLSALSTLFFTYELNPVAPKAQSKVPIPEGLDLDAWINEPLPESDKELNLDNLVLEGDGKRKHRKSKKGKKGKKAKAEESSEEDEELVAQRRAARLERLKLDPYYIGADTSTQQRLQKETAAADIDVDSIPVVKLKLGDVDLKSLQVEEQRKANKKSGGKKSSKTTRVVADSTPIVLAEEDMPDNVTLSGGEEEAKRTSNKVIELPKKSKKGVFDSDYSDLGAVDLSSPLREDEQFPNVRAYASPEESRRQEEEKIRLQRLAELQYTGEDVAITRKPKKIKKSSKNNGTTTADGAKKTKKVKRKSTSETLESPAAAYPSLDESPGKKSTTRNGNDRSFVSERLQAFADDNLTISYELSLDAPSASDICIVCALQVLNASKSILKGVRFNFPQSFDFQVVKGSASPTGASDLSLDDDVQPGASGDLIAKFKVSGNPRIGLCIRGDVRYSTNAAKKSNIEIPIPVSMFMTPIPRLEPQAFADLLTNTDEFAYAGATQFPIKSVNQASTEDALRQALQTVTQLTRLQIVEIVPGAASLYGQTCQDYKVAGLVKYSAGSDDGGLTMNLDLKCSDEDFLKGLIREVEEAFFA
ncbi:hypothetical protein BZG36_04066 [Bifiguratus adelaidae]|uniref:AP-3 complex subunit delta n=1 Tax=Bifiguratus adelaidae TaxID=1938954 RepID=A0A261XY49_9FUNG|nr:hypothetical protein BZG36_04066 [Bifiguratus adelaidae]